MQRRDLCTAAANAADVACSADDIGSERRVCEQELRLANGRALLTLDGEEKRSHSRMQQAQHSMCPHGMTMRSVDSASWQMGQVANPFACKHSTLHGV